MNDLLFIAALLSIFIGLIHSILGEVLIFRHLRDGSIIPTIAKPPLRERNIRILWATWHITSFFGWAIGAILFHLALADQVSMHTIILFITISMFVSGLLVLIATKGRHPGWIGLLTVAVLCWFV